MKRWLQCEHILLGVVVAEASLGGNGYLTEVLGVRLRVVLFFLCLSWTALRLTRLQPARLPREIIILCACFFGLTAFDAALGWSKGYPAPEILAELKPLSYFPMILFFVVAIQGPLEVEEVFKIQKVCGAVMAFAFISVIASARVGLIEDVRLFEFLHQSDEFIFRGYPIIGFFFKSSFYVVIAAILFIFDDRLVSQIFGALCVVATALTLTRGIALALLCCLICGMLLKFDYRRTAFCAAQLILLVFSVLIVSYYDPSTAAALQRSQTAAGRSLPTLARDGGLAEGTSSFNLPAGVSAAISRPTDDGRIADIKYVISSIDLGMIFVGRGLGAPIRMATRSRIELNYLEIFFKQGLWGLGFWFAVFVYMTVLYIRAERKWASMDLRLFLCGLFVFIANATNPFLPGSIGMAAVFISIAGLIALQVDIRNPA